jgi:hypothetical protein
LRVAAVNHGRRVVFDDDVWIHAVAFDDVLAGNRAAGSLRDEHDTSIEQRSTPADAHHTAPSALSNQGTESRLAEHVGKDVAV